MVQYQTNSKMPWNLENIRFLYPPDDFIGGFTNAKMQERHKALQEEKINNLINGLLFEKDPARAMRVLHANDHIQFLRNNLEKFKNAGSFEKTVLSLYYRKNSPFSAGGEFAIWLELFSACDRNRMLAEGQPFPYQKTTAYRGSVVGVRQGFSWTLSKEKTAWMLERWQDKSMGGGTIYAMEIGADDIMIYRCNSDIEEVILRPDLVVSCEPREITSLS
jgi:hypothetical protein